jgi:hypothetical protein
MIPGPRYEAPNRLDDALRYAVARVEEDSQNVDAIIRHLGWDGGRLPEAPICSDQPINLVDERPKQAASRAIERLREDGFVPDAVERSIALIESSLPILNAEVCEALMGLGSALKGFPAKHF